jgi:hypothetical protein
MTREISSGWIRRSGSSTSEENGQRTAAFQVWDRPETPLSDLVEQLNAANAIADAEGRNRLTLTVDPDGAASIRFLDTDGRVVQRIAPPR